MGISKIDWGIPGLRTWNPITGCPRGCGYCVVRNRVWPRIRHYFGDHDYNEVHFHPKRLKEPLKLKKPTTFFTGFYSDFEYWPLVYAKNIFSVCKQCPQHTFMFLSKNALSKVFWPWPDNTMQGQTLTGEEVFKGIIFMIESKADIAVDMLETFPHPFLSIEPLRGPLKLNRMHQHIDRVIVGAQTGPGAVIPKPEWIQSIRDSFHPRKLYWKANIRKYL